MVSSVKYPSFKNLKIHTRQPISRFVVVVLLLSVAIAAFPLFLFGGMSAYVASGPVLALLAFWRPGKTIEEPADEDEAHV